MTAVFGVGMYTHPANLKRSGFAGFEAVVVLLLLLIPLTLWMSMLKIVNIGFVFYETKKRH